MVRVKRSRIGIGKGYPKGFTKIEILLFLSEGKRLRKELERHLKTNFGISEGRGITNHLTNLYEEGLIVKERSSPGKPIYYDLNPGFGSVKAVFNMMREHGREEELMRSRYWSSVMGDNVFEDIVVDVLKAVTSSDVREVLGKGSEGIEPPDMGWLEMLDLTQQQIRRVRESEARETAEYAESIAERVYELKAEPDVSGDMERVVDLVAKESVQRMMASDGGLCIYSSIIPEVCFPLEERDIAKYVLTVSPTAFRAISDIGSENDRFTPMVMEHIYPLVLARDLMFSLYSEEELREKGPIMAQRIRSQVRGGPSVIVPLLRSLALGDVFSGKIEDDMLLREAVSSNGGPACLCAEGFMDLMNSLV